MILCATLDHLPLSESQERSVRKVAAFSDEEKNFSTLVTSASIFDEVYFPNKLLPKRMAAEGNNPYSLIFPRKVLLYNSYFTIFSGEEIDREILAAQQAEMDEDAAALNNAAKKGRKRKRSQKGK